MIFNDIGPAFPIAMILTGIWIPVYTMNDSTGFGLSTLLGIAILGLGFHMMQ